jgi:biotin carboxylase
MKKKDIKICRPDVLFLIGIPETHIERTIARAKKFGFYVILGDSIQQLDKFSLLISESDETVEIDFYDLANVLAVTEKIQKKKPLTAIFTFKEMALENIAFTAKKYGLKCNHPDVIRHCNNKFLTRNKLKEAGLLSPLYSMCRNIDEVASFFDDVGHSIIIKPHSQQGSLGVQRIDNRSQLEHAYFSCLRHCSDSLVLAEALIEGKEISLEAVIYNGHVSLFGITEKYLFPGTYVESGHRSSYQDEAMTFALFEQQVSEIVSALGIEFGPLHIEGFITEKGFIVGEVHTRYGGDSIVTITEQAQQIDITSPIFAELCNEPNYHVPQVSFTKVSEVRFFQLRHDYSFTPENIELIAKIPGVQQLSLDPITVVKTKPINSSHDRGGWVLVTCDDAAKIQSVFNQVEITLTSS